MSRSTWSTRSGQSGQSDQSGQSGQSDRSAPATTAATAQQVPAGGPVAFLPGAALVLAGLLFVVYPALRPYSSETGLAGARAFASWQWTAAHLCGVVGFVALAQVIGRLGLGRYGPTLLALGATLVLPYYGAEVFGVGAVGTRAIDRGQPGLVSLVDDIRYGVPASVLFGIGLVLLAVGGVVVGVTLWRRSARATGALLGTGLALYLPQFYLPPAGRIVHGAVLGLGLLLLATREISARRRGAAT